MNAMVRAALACACAGIVAAVAFAAFRDGDAPSAKTTAGSAVATPRTPAAPSRMTGTVAEILSSPTGPLSVEPTVPRPDTKPCVVTLFTDENLMSYPGFDYSPPADCPRPWSKIVLEMDMTPVRRTGTIANIKISLDGGAELVGSTFYSRHWDLFVGAPQISATTPRWHVERDLTHYAALLAEPEDLFGSVSHTWDNSGVGIDDDEVVGSARILFYPPSVANPAPRVPDAVLADGFPYLMPRNIVRAYVEVIAQGIDDTESVGSDRYWYTCLPDRVLATHPGLMNPFAIGDVWGGVLSSSDNGCGGGSYRQVIVLIDGAPVGTAPLMPWLPNNVHRRFPDTLDPPLPAVQALNFMPYHVDITPFAALLNSGTRHMLTLRVFGDTAGSFTSNATLSGKMFIYRDPKRAIVPGKLTAYVMAPAIASPTGAQSFTRTGDVLQGTVVTHNDRTWMTEGNVDTSEGLITTRVLGRNRFDNWQALYVDGDTYPNYRGYAQYTVLDSWADQVSVRMSGASIIALDARSLHQPLQLFYALTGHMEPTDEGGYWGAYLQGAVLADQTRDIRAEHWRGATHYTSNLHDHFHGERFHDFLAGTDSGWLSRREYSFVDSLASCFRAKRTSAMGVLATSDTGVGCAGGINDVLWHARPDGSPEMMGWAE